MKHRSRARDGVRLNSKLRLGLLSATTLIGSVALGGVIALPASATPQASWPNLSTPVNCTPTPTTLCNPNGQPGGLDHFLCYQLAANTVDSPTPSQVELEDQFGTHDHVALAQVSPPSQMLCNPVQKTLPAGGPGGAPAGTSFNVSQPDSHLYCYPDTVPTSTVSQNAAGYDVTNQFGTFHIDAISNSTHLCLPTWKYDENNPTAPGSVPPAVWTDPNGPYSPIGSGSPAPSGLGLNHFQCYSVSATTTSSLPAVQLVDEFASYPSAAGSSGPQYPTLTVGPVAELCAPVIKAVYGTGGSLGSTSDTNSDGVNGAHLLCFQISPTATLPSHTSLDIGNQFTNSAFPPNFTVSIETNGFPSELCLPSLKTASVSTQTPESPLTILLPIVGGLMGAGVWMAIRRRRITVI